VSVNDVPLSLNLAPEGLRNPQVVPQNSITHCPDWLFI